MLNSGADKLVRQMIWRAAWCLTKLRVLVVAVLVAVACSNDAPDDAFEPIGQTSQPLTTNERILLMEGVISNAANADWRPGSGTTVSAGTPAFEGTQGAIPRGEWSDSKRD